MADNLRSFMSVQHSMLEQKISGVSMPTNSTSQGGITRFGKKVYVDTKQLSNTKKRKKTKKNADIEKIVSFKPLVTGRPSSEPSVKIDDYKATMKQLPDEEEYLKEIPLKFFDHQIDAVRWMYWIEASKTDRDKHVGGILGDVMGLGKTIDGLGIIYYDIFKAKKQGLERPKNPTLVVAPLTLLHHWQQEATNRLGLTEEDVLIYHGTKRFKLLHKAIESGKLPTLIIATYETVQNDFARKTSISKKNTEYKHLYDIEWARVLLDEAHVARNPKTSTFRALKAFKTKALFCITGTPIVNYPDDVRILSLLCTPSNPLTYGSSMQETMWKSKYLLRRTKDMLDIPPITYKDEWIEFSPEERVQYQQLEAWAQSTYDKLMEMRTLSKEYQKILLVLIRLRQACDHMMLQSGHEVTSKLLEEIKKELGICVDSKKRLRTEEDDKKPDYRDPLEFGDDVCFVETKEEERRRKRRKKRQVLNLDQQETTDPEKHQDSPSKKRKAEEAELPEEPPNQIPRVELEEDDQVVLEDEEPQTTFVLPPPPVQCTEFTYSSKMLHLAKILEEIKEKDPGGKTVVFSQFTTMLDVTEAMLLKMGYKVCRFDGRQQKSETRKQIIHDFVHDPEHTVLLASLKAGGVGLNLIPARYLCLLDPWWNSSVESQAFDRIHRIGQLYPVTIYRILVKKTIEEEVLVIQRKKSNQESVFFDATDTRILSVRDLHSVFTTMKTRSAKMKAMNHM